ncbi:ATP-binding protein [Streptomyces sp. ISID311]|uniref:sensor histidine kinase n=1 Tax=Streptomyces sp. ISID311 TaxID=2601673 RepID=UPI0011BD4265|nr:ATP-binding protein [Streptomyces sp. ISID311]TXC99469.1 HAMP domain-containing protein [Streptomyces sp. ISID311]
MTLPVGEDEPGRRLGGPRFLHRLPIVLRLVIAVAAVMSLVLGGAAALVYWRVESALDQQLDADLATYHHSLVRNLRAGHSPSGPDGSAYQVLDTRGNVIEASALVRKEHLLTAGEITAAADGTTIHRDIGGLLPLDPHTLRLKANRVRLPDHRTVIAVAALRRGHRDEALRELLAQLALADGLTLLAASYVGYRTARAALDPVERYRHRAATLADAAPRVRLPVPGDRNDELTRLGHTLNQMLDRLESAAARERRFLADASHELRTPLSLLRAELDVALHRPRTADELTETLRSVDTEVQRLIDLSNALLDIEDLGSTQHLTRAPVDLADLVGTAVSPHLRAAEGENRSITVDVTPATVNVDARWLRPALGNLISNALRHGHGSIHVTAVARDGRLHLTVTDEGPGFPPDFLPRAFDRFTRAEASRTTKGSGLGLAFVAAVATSHGGTAHAENTECGAAVILDISC